MSSTVRGRGRTARVSARRFGTRLPRRRLQNDPEPVARPSEFAQLHPETPQHPRKHACRRTLERHCGQLRESHEALRCGRPDIRRAGHDHPARLRDLLDAVHDPLDHAVQAAIPGHPHHAALGRPRGSLADAGPFHGRVSAQGGFRSTA